jgi:S-adenosylmethionine synthetase
MLKTAESITPMHPDKICDRISDAVLDACLEQDPMSRAGIETLGGHGWVTVTGEVTTTATINIEEIVRRVAGDHNIKTNVVKQSPDIAQGVDTGGAGDQGIMVGYACRDNEALVPQEHYLAKDLCKRIYVLHPRDGKTQITLDNNNRITAVVASFQKTTGQELKEIIDGWIKDKKVSEEIEILTNPTGTFELGGFDADAGLTGRKIVCDAYGPQIPVGGGAFSGKDSTKVDRSAAYMARKVAVDLLKNFSADEVTVKLGYAIGKAEPVMAVYEMTKGDQTLQGVIDKSNYDLTPKGIIDFLELRKPQFEKIAEWGSFGNDFKWDK